MCPYFFRKEVTLKSRLCLSESALFILCPPHFSEACYTPELGLVARSIVSSISTDDLEVTYNGGFSSHEIYIYKLVHRPVAERCDGARSIFMRFVIHDVHFSDENVRYSLWDKRLLFILKRDHNSGIHNKKEGSIFIITKRVRYL